MTRLGRSVLVVLMTAVVGCGVQRADGAGADGGADAAARCRPEGGVSASPTSIAGVVALANALPRPLTLGCFLQSLDRPLAVNATLSLLSLQPAAGPRSPRIFLFSGALLMSIVPQGDGSQLLEFGQFIDETKTVKGELHFPIEGEVTAAEPYDNVREPGGGTTCRFCHAAEQRVVEIEDAEAFASDALQPRPIARVELEALRRERALCDPEQEPHRCAVFGGLFDHGEVTWGEFPANLPTFTQ